VEDETRNAQLNGNRNPECWGDFSRLVKIEQIRFLGISRYKVWLRFWLDLNSEVSCSTNSNWDFFLIWICSWLQSSQHSGFRLPFNSAFRVSSSTERALQVIRLYYEMVPRYFIIKTYHIRIMTYVVIKSCNFYRSDTYRVAKTHRMPYLYGPFFAKEPYN